MTDLASDEDPRAREILATLDPDGVGALIVMSRHRNDMVRLAVARNPEVPLGVIEALAKDKSALVRAGVASSEVATVEILEALARDRDAMVREKAMERGMVPAR